MSPFFRQSAAGRTALVGVLSAGGLAVLWLACLAPSGRTGITAAAGLFPVAVVLMAGRAAGWLCWAVISLLGLLLLPDKAVAALFGLFLGLYPVVKSRLEQLRTRAGEWCAKLLVFNGLFALIWFGLGGILGLTLPQWLTAHTWMIFLGANIVFVAYDIGLSKLIAMLIVRLRVG